MESGENEKKLRENARDQYSSRLTPLSRLWRSLIQHKHNRGWGAPALKSVRLA